MLEAYIYDGLRSPFGRQDGSLSRVRPDDMLGDVIKAVVARSGFAPETIDDVNVGCEAKPARTAATLRAMPFYAPACRSRSPAIR